MVFGRKDKKKPKASLGMLTEKVMELEDRLNKLVLILQTHSPALQLHFAKMELEELQKKVEERLIPKKKDVVTTPFESVKEGKVSEEAKQVLRI